MDDHKNAAKGNKKLVVRTTERSSSSSSNAETRRSVTSAGNTNANAAAVAENEVTRVRSRETTTRRDHSPQIAKVSSGNNHNNNGATTTVREIEVDKRETNEPNEDHEHDDGVRRLMNLKNVSDGEDEMRPNKLFPVQNERDILLRKVRSVLNKVSSGNFHRVRKRWLNLLPSGDEERQEDGPQNLGMEQIGEVLQLLIAKALDDTIYMHIYAGLMGYVVARKAPEISFKIRQLMNSQLHHELQKLTTDKELALFNRCTQRVDAARRRKVSLHRFIAELYGEKGCTSKFLFQRVTDLLIVNNPSDVDENVECLCVLMTFAGEKLEQVKKTWVEDIFKKLGLRQTETPQTVSKRIQFMILDLMEMRTNGWSPHNKWWSPSVQIAPDPAMDHRRERSQSHNEPVSRRSQEEPPNKVQKKQVASVDSTAAVPTSVVGDPSGSVRPRTRSEGSNAPSAGLKNGIYTPKHLQMQNKLSGVLTANQSRSLMALLNKVSPYNLDRIAQQLYCVLTEETMDEAVNFIVDKILDDSFYTRTHASLVMRVSCKPRMKSFGRKVASRIMRLLEKNPDSKDGFQFLAELYNLNLINIHQVRTALGWLNNCSPGMISSSVESLVIFLFISGAKLEEDVNDATWMNRLIEFWEKKASLVAHNHGRPMCLLKDVIELRQNKWARVRQPHWIPPTIDLPTIRFEPESLIRLFQSDRIEFLRFVKGETSTLNRIERFCKEALEYAVRHGNWERDSEFLRQTGACIRVLMHERLLKRGRLESFLGAFMPEVIVMKRRNAKAWDNLGVVMSEVY